MFLIGLDHLLNYEGWIVQFHQLRDVYYLVVTELEYHVLLHKVFQLGVIQIQTYSYVEKEPSGHCSPVWVDSNHLLHLRPWIYRHKDGPWVFHVLKGDTLHQQIFCVQFDTPPEMSFRQSFNFLLHDKVINIWINKIYHIWVVIFHVLLALQLLLIHAWHVQQELRWWMEDVSALCSGMPLAPTVIKYQYRCKFQRILHCTIIILHNSLSSCNISILPESKITNFIQNNNRTAKSIPANLLP